MSDAPAPAPPPERRTSVLRAAGRVLLPGRRLSDARLRRYGLTAVVTLSLLAMVRDTLRSEREDRRRETDILMRALSEQTTAITRAMGEVTVELRALSGRQSDLEENFATLQALALGRFKCPEPRVVVRRVEVPVPTPPPPTTVVVQTPAAPGGAASTTTTTVRSGGPGRP